MGKLRIRRQPIEPACVEIVADRIELQEARGRSLHVVSIELTDDSLINLFEWVRELMLRRARKHEGLMKELLAARNG